MTATSRVQLIQDVLGSAHIFSSAVNDLMQERLQAVIGEQLTFSQLKLLKLVDRTEAYNISQVADFLGVSNAAASKAVDRLVRRGLLVRSEAEGDRRAVELSLTEAGQRILDEYEVVTAEALEQIFGQFSADGLRQTADLLDKLSLSLVDEGRTKEEEACFRCSIYFRDKCLLRVKSGRLCHFHLRRNREEESGLADNGYGSRRD
jgi:DNA-binding MarR family transcriptional regulator